MKIFRRLLPILTKQLTEGKKGVVLYGPRQVGKTTLANDILSAIGGKSLILNGDTRGPWWEAFTSREIPKLRHLITGYDTVFVDEAQRIPEVGLSLKILRDTFPSIRLLVTGSSSLDLASTISEPLTGRVYTYHLYPISQQELRTSYTPIELEAVLEERLVYGSYPELFSLDSREAQITYLENITNSYLYKDLLEFADVRNSTKIHDLLKLLAFQIGSQVSLSELATQLEINRGTVERYIDLLEKSFVIFRLSGLSRNLRKEVTKMDKIYFYDTGVRNSLIGNFNEKTSRDDMGRLWENFLIVERMKYTTYNSIHTSQYFWRLTSGAEIDYVEETEGKLTGYEFKYGQQKAKAPKSWKIAYPESQFYSIQTDNWQPFII